MGSYAEAQKRARWEKQVCRLNRQSETHQMQKERVSLYPRCQLLLCNYSWECPLLVMCCIWNMKSPFQEIGWEVNWNHF